MLEDYVRKCVPSGIAGGNHDSHFHWSLPVSCKLSIKALSLLLIAHSVPVDLPPFALAPFIRSCNVAVDKMRDFLGLEARISNHNSICEKSKKTSQK